MGRQVLPDDLAEQLRRVPDADRLRHVLAFVDAGWTPTTIAHALGTDPSTMRRHVREARANGVKPARLTVPGPDDDVIALSQFAARVVANRTTVYRWAREGIIPGLLPDRGGFLDRQQAEAWLADHPELDQAHADEWMDSTEAAEALGLTWHGLYWRIEHGQVEAVQTPAGRWRVRRSSESAG